MGLSRRLSGYTYLLRQLVEANRNLDLSRALQGTHGKRVILDGRLLRVKLPFGIVNVGYPCFHRAIETAQRAQGTV